MESKAASGKIRKSKIGDDSAASKMRRTHRKAGFINAISQPMTGCGRWGFCMNTVFLLMARYNGLPIIPVDVVCRDYFQHLTVEKFLRKVLAAEISLPIVRSQHVRTLI